MIKFSIALQTLILYWTVVTQSSNQQSALIVLYLSICVWILLRGFTCGQRLRYRTGSGLHLIPETDFRLQFLCAVGGQKVEANVSTLSKIVSDTLQKLQIQCDKKAYHKICEHFEKSALINFIAVRSWEYAPDFYPSAHRNSGMLQPFVHVCSFPNLLNVSSPSLILMRINIPSYLVTLSWQNLFLREYCACMTQLYFFREKNIVPFISHSSLSPSEPKLSALAKNDRMKQGLKLKLTRMK